MGESDLIRRLDSAISSKSLHPNYARGLLKEAREALQVDTPKEMPEDVEGLWCVPSEEERDRLCRMGAIMDVPPSNLSMCNLSTGAKTCISNTRASDEPT